MKREYVEETNRDAVMIGAAKLVATEALPVVSNFLYFCLCYLGSLGFPTDLGGESI